MKVSGYVMSGNPEKYGRLSEPELSPQEIAFAEKQRLKVLDEMTALHESEYHEFPAHALRDMTDKTFASLLGVNQFVGGVE